MAYVFAEQWQRERKRLAGIEAGVDPVSCEVFSRLGVGPGWRCAEVGAGGGSLAQWLADRVGDTGHVVATDLDTSYLVGIEAPNLQILHHDFMTEDPPGEPFDLVHTRLVIEHMPDPQEALKRLASWIRPGGLLVVESGDWSTKYEITPSAEFAEVWDAVEKFLVSVGFAPMFGRRLPVLLSDVGIVDLDCQTHSRMIRGGTPEMEAFTLTIERVRAGMVAAGLVSDEEVAAALAVCADPSFVIMSFALVSGWGRRPIDA